MRDHAWLFRAFRWSWFISYKTTRISFIVHSGTIKIQAVTWFVGSVEHCWVPTMTSAKFVKMAVRAPRYGQWIQVFAFCSCCILKNGILQLLSCIKTCVKCMVAHVALLCRTSGTYLLSDTGAKLSQLFASVNHLCCWDWKIETTMKLSIYYNVIGRIPVLWMAALVEFSQFAAFSIFHWRRAQHHGRHNTNFQVIKGKFHHPFHCHHCLGRDA